MTCEEELLHQEFEWRLGANEDMEESIEEREAPLDSEENRAEFLQIVRRQAFEASTRDLEKMHLCSEEFKRSFRHQYEEQFHDLLDLALVECPECKGTRSPNYEFCYNCTCFHEEY